MSTTSCVRSGFCCKQASCPYGQGVPCIHLKVAVIIGEVSLYRCGNYEAAKHDQVSPAFGAGCCSPLFNEDRTRILELLNESP